MTEDELQALLDRTLPPSDRHDVFVEECQDQDVPDRIDRPTTWTLSSSAALTICGRREADALVDDVHAAIAGAHGDLLGAVGMAVEAGLADQHLERRPSGETRSTSRLADRGSRPSVRTSTGCGDAGGRAIFAEGSRSASPHSPVVTPALARRSRLGMMLRPSGGGAQLGSAPSPPRVALARQAFSFRSGRLSASTVRP
jgi:hypothetical protein